MHEGHELDPEKVKAGRRAEFVFMWERGIWTVKPLMECWEKNWGWAGVGKVGRYRREHCLPEGIWEPLVRCKLVARDFKGKDTDRDYLFAEAPPFECKRFILSRASTRRVDGMYRKIIFIDARKAHLNPKCEDDVYIKLPKEFGLGKEWCGN